MTDQQHERPLTRRELRMRAQAEAAAAAEQHEASSHAEVPFEEPSLDRSAAEELVAEIEISPLNEDGTPRSRREIRQLREAAIAELLGTEEPEADDVPQGHLEAEDLGEAVAAPVEAEHEEPEHEEPELESEPELDETEKQAEEPESEEAAESDDSGASISDFGAPTEAYSLEEIREAEALAGEPTEALSLDDLLATDEVDDAPTNNGESIAALFGGLESDDDGVGDEDDDATASQGNDAPDSSMSADELFGQLIAAESSQFVEDDADSGHVPVEAENLDAADWLAGEPDEVVDEAHADDAWLAPDEEAFAPSEAPTSGYSFPDIQPPEEWRSVFDNPSRGAEAAEGATGDFDDLISRAVAQEGSTGSTGASALILPSHPETTGGLSGPLGATGELFVTGSIELPKALGETGGHSAIHDSVELDPFLTGGQPSAMGQTSDAGPVPVSALSAVSARRRPEIPVVAEPTKDRSKLPIILALTGGGLLILLVGGAVYAVSQGMFG